MARDRSRSRDRDTDRRRRNDDDERGHRHHRSSRHRDETSDDERRERRRREKESSSRDKDRHASDRRERRRHSDSEDEEERRHRKREKKEKHRSRCVEFARMDQWRSLTIFILLVTLDRETSEERKARKRAKKAVPDEAALLAAEEQRRAAAEVSLYSAVDNPFNDANLTDRFVWGKKREKEKKAGLTAEEAAMRDAQRRAEAEEELERLNRRRADREAEMQLREEEAMRMARLQESAQMVAWHAKEDDFHLEQAMRRAAIRTREGRAKPIDLLALNLKWSQPRIPGQEDEDEEDEGIGLDVDLEEPYLIFDNLTLEETEELYEDIQMYISLEKSESNLDFWRAMIVVCSAALETLRSERTMGRAAFIEQNRANESVKNDITNLLRGKSLDELRQLQDSVRAKLSSGDPIDVEYWEGLLKELAVWMAKAKLKAMHEVVLRNRLEHLRLRQRDEAAQVQKELADTADEEAAASLAAAAAAANAPADQEAEPVVREEWFPAMAPKSVSKVPMEDQNLQLLDADEELKNLVRMPLMLRAISARLIFLSLHQFAARRLVAQARFVPKKRAPAGESEGPVDAADALVKAEAAKELDEDEEIWNAQSEQVSQTYSWQDKYRPRKPRYFNKVITGFEWNKYNQTHYEYVIAAPCRPQSPF